MTAGVSLIINIAIFNSAAARLGLLAGTDTYISYQHKQLHHCLLLPSRFSVITPIAIVVVVVVEAESSPLIKEG
jgi:hypothetical protein